MKIKVKTGQTGQFFMGTALDYSALFENQNLFGFLDRAESVRNDQRSFVFHESL